MTRQLENPEDSHQPDNPDEGQRHRGWSTFVLGKLRAQRDKKRQNGQEVDDVHDVFEEVDLARGADEAHDEFKGEPADTDGLYDEEGILEGTERWWNQDGFVWDGGMRRGCVLLQDR